MGKISYLQIELNKSIYAPGEMVAGSVSLGVVERIKVRSVKFELHGEAYVHWSETHGTGEDQRTHHYSDRETYIDLSLFFANQQQSGEHFLEVGEYKYPFQLALPPTLPSSFEIVDGHIRYWANAKIDIPWAIDKYAKMTFSVINMMDLNGFPPAIRMPIGMSNNTQVGCCKKGIIEYDMNIPKAGYVPGEGIPFNVTINNKSDSKCKNVRVILMKKVTLHTVHKTKRVWTEITKVLMPRHIIPENTADKWQGILVIPAVVSSIPRTVCRIIEVVYEVSLHFKAGSLGLGYTIEIPIVIGYVPIRDASGGAGIMPNFAFQPSAIPGNLPAHTDSKADGDSLQSNHATYKPMYPVYQGLAQPAHAPPPQPPPYTQA